MITHILSVVGPSIVFGGIVGSLCRKHVLPGMIVTILGITGYFFFLGFKEAIFSTQWPLMWNLMEMLEQLAVFTFLFLIPSIIGFAIAQRFVERVR